MPVAVITGGGSGIGQAVAERFAAGGYSIALCGRDATKLANVRTSILARNSKSKVICLAEDFSQPTAARRMVDETAGQLGPPDVLVNSAGQASLRSVEEMSSAEFERTLLCNVHTTFYACQAVLSCMRRRRRGVIVNVSSLAAIDPFPGFAVYGACKSWIDVFTQALANEVKLDHIAVFSVRPGAVETPMLRGCFPDYPSDRALPPSAVADVIWQLTLPAWKNSSGAAIPVRCA